jgi:D-cysteine desulfhydrase
MKTPSKLNLANIPTPIQKFNFNGCDFLMKRDDFTGVELSGNKVRKLEYLLKDATKQKADYIFTSGGEQSNHARATVIAAVSQGIKTKIFLWGSDRKNSEGNLFLDRLFGAETVFLNKKNYEYVEELKLAEKEKLEKKGHKVYMIPEGGSSTFGIWGYINAVNEIKEQINTNKIGGVISAAGSGGTSAGLLIGSQLYGLNLKVYAVNVLYEGSKIKDRILNLAQDCVEEFNLKVDINPDNLEVLEGYSNEGYKHIEPRKIKVIKDFVRQSGIVFDPTYTGKAFYAFNDLFLHGKKSTNVMFLHTGGIFGTFAKRKEYLEV